MGNLLVTTASIMLNDRGAPPWGSAPLVTSGIDNISGTIADGQTITINGGGFTTKSLPKPLIWWEGSDNSLDPSALGRNVAWDTTASGALSSVITAPNSTMSVRLDHGASEGAILGRVDFTSDQIYVNRQTYDDFNVTTDFAITADYINLLNGPYVVGETVTGGTSGATGIVTIVTGTELTFSTTAGIPTDFVNGEVMTGGTSTATSDNDQTGGVFETFNDKNIRFNTSTGIPSLFPNAQGANDADFDISPANTGSTFTATNIDQGADTWHIEEFVYQASTIDVEDGIFDFIVDNTLPYDQQFITNTTANPQKYDQLVQVQVSNGAQPLSFSYYSFLYIDTTFHRVVVGDASTYSTSSRFEPFIPVTWSDTSITGKLRLGSFSSFTGLYMYVVNSAGEPVTTAGFLLA